MAANAFLCVFRLRKHLVVTILPTKGAQNIPLIPALYALLNPDDGSKSNLLGRVRPGRSPATKRISLQKTLCSVGLLYKTMNSLFVILCAILLIPLLCCLAEYSFRQKSLEVFGGS